MALVVDFDKKMGEILLNQKGNMVLIDICQANCICVFTHTHTSTQTEIQFISYITSLQTKHISRTCLKTN